MTEENLTPDLANKLREALGMAKKEMKELYAMGSLYSKSLTGATEAATRSNYILGQQGALVTSLNKSIDKMKAGTRERLQLENLTNQVLETANDLANARNQTMADLVLKQTMLSTGLTDEAAEQAKNLKLLLDQGAITEGIYNMHIKRLQEEQAHINHLKEEVELQEEIAKSILEIKEEAESWKKSFTKTLETAKAIARDPAVLGSLLMNEGIKKIEEAYEGFEELHHQGLSAGQAIQAQFKGLSLMSMLGLSDTKGALQGFTEQYGAIGGISSDVVDQVGQMAHHFGISGQEAAKLNAQLSMMPGETSKSAADAAEHVGHLAEMQGIAPGKIMKDMAGNTAEMARAGNKGAEAFGKSVVALHKMGVEMATASKIADGLLDFESSINNQMEASVLLGREINLDKARELALNNDLEGATAEVLKNVGGSAEFGKLNRLQQDALAKSAGMTVEEMQKAIDAQEEQNKYYGEGASLLDNIIGKTMEVGGGAIGFMKENAMWMASTIQMIGQQNLGKIKQYAMDAAHWTKEKAHMLWKKAMGGGKGPADIGTDKLSEAGSKAPKDMNNSSSKVPKDSGKSTGGLTKSIEKINPAKLLAGAAALVLVAAAVFVFAKAAQEFMNVSWSAIGKAIVGMLALVGALALMGTFMAGPQALFLLAGAAAMLVIAAAVLVLGLAIQEMAKGLDALAPTLTQLVPGLAVLATAGAGLALIGVSLMAIGAGLTYMSAAGIAAMPILGMLIGLAAVAPALSGLANALMGGGGETEKNDKMDELIAEVRSLKAEMANITINLDGKKVGEGLRGSMNASRIR